KVLIGGDWGSGNPNTSLVKNSSAKLESFVIPTATTVSVDAATTINASAKGGGNGGKVVLWSDSETTFAGTILARGGAKSGDGGFVEVIRQPRPSRQTLWSISWLRTTWCFRRSHQERMRVTSSSTPTSAGGPTTTGPPTTTL